MDRTTLRAKVHGVLERSERSDSLGRLVDMVLIFLITINVISVILETVDWIYDRFSQYFEFIEIVSVTVFTLEYALRLWCSAENSGAEESRMSARLRYAVSPLAIIDLLAIAPFYLAFLVNIDLRFLRVLRLLRIFKLTRYSSAMTMLLDALREEASSLFAGFFILMVLLVLAASGAYLVEHDTQPSKFGSIPDAMWWAVATLTTVGYGDVTPVTSLGKLFGACVTVIGIGMAALPAGILASGLADQLRRKREALTRQYRDALEDGIIDTGEEQALEALRKELGLSRTLAKDVLEDVQKERASAVAPSCPNCGHPLTATVTESR